MNTTEISPGDIDKMTPEDVEKLATKLEQDNYTNPFDSLADWHLLRAIAFQRPDLVEPYVALLDLQPYDES